MVSMLENSDNEEPEVDGDSKLDRKIRMTLYPVRARARIFLDDVLEGNRMMIFIMLLVFFGLIYELLLKLLYGLQDPFCDALLIVCIFIYTSECVTKIITHIVAFQTLHKYVTDPFCMLDFCLVAFDLVMFFVVEEEENSGSSNASSARVLKTLKLLKSARALRIVGRAWKLYIARLEKAKMSEEQREHAEILSQELQATMVHFCANEIPDLLYSIIETAGDDAFSAELAQNAYGLAMLLVEQPHNKDT